MPTNAINDTGVKYLYDKLHGEIEPVAEAVSDSEVTIEGNPLSFNTLSSQNAKSTILSVEPIQDLHGYDKPWVGGAGKNLFDISLVNTSNFNISDLTISNKVTDARTYFSFQLQKYKNGSLVGAALLTRDIDRTGEIAIGFTLSGDDYDSIRLKHNGTSADIEIALIPFTKSGSFAISFNVLGANPNSVDGLKFSNIQIEVGSQATSYEPYENICPISGRSEIGILGCGVNLWNPDDMTVGKWINGSGEITDNATGVTNTNYIKIDKTLGYLRFSKAGSQALNNFAVAFYDLNKNFISRALNEVSMAIPNNAEYIIYACGITDNPTIDKVKNAQLQLEYGNQATQYTAYQPSNDLTISLGQTVYGGTLDVENGVLVVNRGIIGANDFESFSTNTTTGGLKYAETETSGSKASGIGICNIAKVDNAHAWESTVPVAQISSTAGRIRFYCDATDRNDFLTKYANLQVCYELATPITIQLTSNEISLLEGVNNISTTGDKITLTYRDGKVATLGDLTSAVDSLDSKIDESKILTDTVTGDKYILVVTNGVLSVQQISN